jgi:hypothetical protein
VTELSLIVNVHTEGTTTFPTFRSIAAMLEHAACAGINVEVVIVLDRSDAVTLKQVSAFTRTLVVPSIQSIETDLGDVGAARMQGVHHASADLIAWLDADDIYSASWLTNAVGVLNTAERDVVVHPAHIVSFGERCVRIVVKASEGSDLNLGIVPAFNPWPSMAATTRSVIESHPFTSIDVGRGFGPEDWQWNLATLGDGIAHLVAPETVLFYREKHGGSLWQTQAQRGVTLRKTALLTDPEWASRYGGIVVGEGDDITLSRSQRFAQQFPALTLPIRAATKKLRPAAQATTAEPEVVEAWMEQAFADAIGFEPEIPSLSDYLAQAGPWSPPFDAFCSSYWQAVAGLGGDLDCLFVGSRYVEEAEVDLINTYRRDHPDEVVGLWCDCPDPEGVGGLDPSVRISCASIDMGVFRYGKSGGQRLLATIAIQLSPKVIHVLHSPLGLRSLGTYGSAISQETQLQLSLRPIDIDAHGAPASLYFDLPTDPSIFQAIHVASQEDADLICVTTGIERALLRVRPAT